MLDQTGHRGSETDALVGWRPGGAQRVTDPPMNGFAENVPVPALAALSWGSRRLVIGLDLHFALVGDGHRDKSRHGRFVAPCDPGRSEVSIHVGYQRDIAFTG